MGPRCRGALEQILDNLLANALDAAPGGWPSPSRSTERDGWVELHVVDQGPGMDDRAARAGLRPLLAGTGSVAGGTGLGLAIVAQLAASSGGSAELRPAPGGGIDAVVRLPAAEPPPYRQRTDAVPAASATFTSP